MAKCYLHDIVNPEPAALTEAHWEELFRRMRESGWFGTESSRIGFINLARHSGVTGGYFAHEGKKKGAQYDENKEPLEPPPFHSFEYLFFVLFEDTAQLLLQSRNIYDYADLSLPIMRNNFLHLLTDLFRWVGVYVAGNIVTLEGAGTAFTQEQLYNTFIGIAQVTELEISRLHRQPYLHLTILAMNFSTPGMNGTR